MTLSAPLTRGLSSAAAGLLALSLAAGSGIAQDKPAAAPGAPAPGAAGAPKSEAPMKKEVAVIKTNHGTIVFEFLPDVAPKMVQNFKDLASSGFYNGTTFHRVIPGFMIQGGDPLSKDDDPGNDGTGGSPNKMQAEFTRKYSHVRGMVSTARASDPNSGSCQFFIMHRDNQGLDGQYTIFGRVIEGMETVDKIAVVRTTKPGDRPIQKVVMESVTVETR
jgi:peptidyl-prolyl cis-trans isomerase B (cyclophilin B)